MSRPKAEYRVGVGASSIMMILVVLAMTALSLLSFSSAQNAEVMADRNMAMVTAYYQAAGNVQYTIAFMDDILMEAENDWMAGGPPTTGEEAPSGDDSQDTSASPMQLLWKAFDNRGLTAVSLDEEEEDIKFTFSTDAGYERMILVKGIINLGMNPRYRITAHELVSLQLEDDTWEYSLWQGSDMNSELIGDE